MAIAQAQSEIVGSHLMASVGRSPVPPHCAGMIGASPQTEVKASCKEEAGADMLLTSGEAPTSKGFGWVAQCRVATEGEAISEAKLRVSIT